MLSWISVNAPALGTIVTLLAVLFPSVQYVLTKKSEDKKHTFAAYHKLIGDLVDTPNPKLDRQIAIIFELRNFKDYFPVSIRLLEGIKEDWINQEIKPRIFKEIDLTVNYMKNKMWLSRE
jgi:hypothetical protein